jgi:hypothetical protein
VLTIVVTWMDGKQESYPCDTWNVENGLLYTDGPRHSPGRCIPLINVRIWTVGD